MVVKLVTLGVVVGATEALVNSLGGVWGAIITAGAVIGALAIIWTKAIRPGVMLGRKLTRAADVLLDLPDQQRQLREWQRDVDGRLDVLEGGGPGTMPDHGLAQRHET